jgi:hypothetical protein
MPLVGRNGFDDLVGVAVCGGVRSRPFRTAMVGRGARCASFFWGDSKKFRSFFLLRK